MQRRTLSLVVAAAMAGVCAGVIGMQSMVRADTLNSKAAKVAPPRIGWGNPTNGVQIGLFSQGEQRTFRYGDTIVLVMRARNVSAAPVNLTVKTPVDLWNTLCEKGRIVLEQFGGGREVPLHIAPGETLELPGIRYAAQIVAPGEKAGGMPNGAYALALPPGEYHAECWLSLGIPNQNDPHRTKAGRAKPGYFSFTVRNDGTHVARVKREKETGDASISWGETLHGLQGGLQRVTEQELAAMPADQRKEVAADEILMRFYIRNTTDKPIRISYLDLMEDDVSCWIMDAKGGDHSVEGWGGHTLAYALPVKTLLPGEKIPVGWGRLQLNAQKPENEFYPLLAEPWRMLQSNLQETEYSSKIQLTAKPGQYTLRVLGWARIEEMPDNSVDLVSGALPFTIASP